MTGRNFQDLLPRTSHRFPAAVLGGVPFHSALVAGVRTLVARAVRGLAAAMLGWAVLGGVGAVAQTTETLDGTSGSNSISTVTTTGSGLTLNLGFYADYLIVGGGGGGGGASGLGSGGGGGGGQVLKYVTGESGNTGAGPLLLTGTNYGITVGLGGAGGQGMTGGGLAAPGETSSAFDLQASGGGAGASTGEAAGGSGVSGGGGSGWTSSSIGGSGSPGGSGGNGVRGDETSAIRQAGGGGGGAGGAGTIATVSGNSPSGSVTGGSGGAGISTDIRGTAQAFAGGGGGGARGGTGTTVTRGSGVDGGGNGGERTSSSAQAGFAGTANRGGGGGGAARYSTSSTASLTVGGAGGSGVVVVRYAGDATGITGGTTDTTTVPGEAITTFDASGTFGIDLAARLGATLTSPISGAGGLTFAGPGRLTLAESNTYEGGTTVTGSGSILTFANTAARPATGVTSVAAGSGLGLGVGGAGLFSAADVTALFAGTLAGVTNDANSSVGIDTTAGDFTYVESITGDRGLVKLGGNTLTLTGSYGATPAVQLFGGTLRVGDGGSTGSLGESNVSGITGTTLAFDRSDANTYAGVISGGVGIGKDGGGRLELTGANSFAGGTVLNGGTLAVSNDSNLGASAGGITLAGGRLEFTSGFAVPSTRAIATAAGTTSTLAVASGTASYAGNISGAGGLVKEGSGTLTLSARNTFTGGTTVNAGTLTLGFFDGGASTLGGTLTVNAGARVDYATADTFGFDNSSLQALVINGGTVGGNQPNYFWFWLTGSPEVTPFPVSMNAGTLLLGGTESGRSGNHFLAPAFTVTGTEPSVIRRADGNSAATLRMRNLTSSTVDVAAGAELRVEVPIISVNAASDSTTNGSGGLTKQGPGLLTLSAANLYSGATVIEAGTLQLAAGGSLANSTVEVATGTLAVNASSALGPGAAVGAAATLEIGAVDAVQASTLSLASGATVSFTAGSATTYSIGGLAGEAAVTAAGSTLAVGGNNASTAYSGPLTAAALVKQGTGTLTLSGANALGDTRIEAGAVFARNADAFGSGTVTLAGGSLKVSPGTSIANSIVLDGPSNVFGSGLVLEYLVVGGGGSGVDGYGGGGGAGGYLAGSMLVTNASYPVTVGAGGARADLTSAGSGNNGENSVLGSIVAIGGGAGGTYNGGTPTSGGSGGGAGSIDNQAGGAGTAGQGNSGAAGHRDPSLTGGGGGGAGAAGGTATATAAGDGGAGLWNDITGSTVWYAGGGGGSAFRSSGTPTPGAGGLGGGGAGGSGSTYDGGDGAPNTGGGGGGAQSNNSAFSRGVGGAGGSGIVVVRYQGDQIATGGTISSGTGSAAGYTVHTFTSGSDTFSLTLGDSIIGTISGPISGAGGFTLDSPGTLTLAGSNSYQGGTTISAGRLAAGNESAFGSGPITLGNGTTLDLGGFAIGNTIFNNGGTVLGAANYSGTQTVAGDATFDGPVAGTVNIGSGGLARFRGQVGGRVEVGSGGIAELDDAATIGGSAELAIDGILRANRTGELEIGRPISGLGSVQKQGPGRLVLSGTNSYTGGTQVEDGTLVINGSILGDVSLAAGSRLGGTGSITGTVGGAGVFGPGNSPGITTVGSIDPSGGLGFEFEITGPLPAWGNAGASVNDVVRATSGTPFTSALSVANTISILLAVPGLDPAAPGTYTAGFFTDSAVDFASSIQDATFDYWVAGEFGSLGDRQQFATGSGAGLEWYTRLSAYDADRTVQWRVVPTTANFGAGDVNGFSTQFVVVPEPGSLALAGLGLAALGWRALRRRRTA